MTRYDFDTSILPLFIMIFGILLSITGLWCIDIGVSAQNMSSNVTNGWWVRDGVQQYHIGLWSVGIGVVILACSCVMATTLRKKND